MQMLRIKMLFNSVMLLYCMLFIYNQASIAESSTKTHSAEAMIEGNFNLNVSDQLPGIKGANLIMNSSNSCNKTNPMSSLCSKIIVTIDDAEIVAECEIIGKETTCWCSTDYIWSGTVVENHKQCLNVQNCIANVSDCTPLCLPKENIRLNGSVEAKTNISEDNLHSQLEKAFNSSMNGYVDLNVTKRPDDKIADFEVGLFATFQTETLASTIKTLEASLAATISVESTGIAKIYVPDKEICYEAKQKLNCTIAETMDSCVWLLIKHNEALVIGSGTQVKVGSSCTNSTTIELLNTTGLWAGTYICRFSKGKVIHSASKELKIALLPDAITIESDPQSPDCAQNKVVQVNITCTIQNSTEHYDVTFTLGETGQQDYTTEYVEDTIRYSATIRMKCESQKPTSVKGRCSFKNRLTNQAKKNTRELLVIYAGAAVCEEDGLWPKTKDGETATIGCDMGRLGNIERKCNGNSWGEQLSLCVKQALNKLHSKVENFGKGLGATQEDAIAIFSILNNNTGADDTYGDIITSVSVLKGMNNAATTIPLDDQLLPGFLGSASNLLNSSWSSGDVKNDHSLSLGYLGAVEGLMKNIKVNFSEALNTPNIQLQVCRSGSVCNRTVFNVDIEVNMTADLVKIIGIQEIAHRLPKYGFPNSNYPSIVVSGILQNNTNSSVNIKLVFPLNEARNRNSKPDCVFWNTNNSEWSTKGCWWIQDSGPMNISKCECNHLTSFTVLMSKHPIDYTFLNELTYIGLGISICSLIVFILIECLVWNAVVKSNLSHFRHTALVNIALCLLLADCSFLASSFPDKLSETWCLILAVAKHFFYLAMFFWTLCLSIMLLHQLIFVFHRLRKKVYVILSITVGYVCPTVTVASTYVFYDQGSETNYYNKKTCWLTHHGSFSGSIYAFLFPIGTIIIMNMFSMVVVIVTLLKPTVSESKTDDKEAAKSIIKVIVFLTPVFGVTWALGFLLFIIDKQQENAQMLVSYAFTIVNSLQGLLILLTGCFGEKRVRDEVLKYVMSGPTKSESKRNLTSSFTKK